MNLQITAAERGRLFDIKSRALGRHPNLVSAADKQWVLDLARRMQEPIHSDVLQRAANSGFNIEGIAAQ
jgi:hypothetical protein